MIAQLKAHSNCKHTNQFRFENVTNMSKKLFVVAFMLLGLNIYAQDKIVLVDMAQKTKFTPEQRSQLKLKKMILALDLNTAQQKEMATIINEQTAKNEALKQRKAAEKASGKVPTADERFELMNKNLDNKIAIKARIKAVLSPEQFAKWENFAAKSKMKIQRKMAQNKRLDNFSRE